MTLAVKCIHNLPPHLSYVYTLSDITKDRNVKLMSWSRGSLTGVHSTICSQQPTQWSVLSHVVLQLSWACGHSLWLVGYRNWLLFGRPWFDSQWDPFDSLLSSRTVVFVFLMHLHWTVFSWLLCCVVECSFECVTEQSDSVHSGVIGVTVSDRYSTESEEHFMFKVDSLLSLLIAVLFIIVLNSIICTLECRGMDQIISNFHI